MSTIDTRPETVDVSHYAGDTLPIVVEVEDNYTAGMEWLAQVRSTRDGTTVDATFTVTPTAKGANLMLSAADTARLAEMGLLLTGRALREAKPEAVASGVTGMLRYSGQWDVQVSAVGGLDPVTTLAQGALTIDMDVSRKVVV